MDRLVPVAIVIAAILMGCGSSETTPSPTATETQAITEAKGSWNKDKIDAFQKAHNEDGRLTPGQKAAGQAPAGGQASK